MHQQLVAEAAYTSSQQLKTTRFTLFLPLAVFFSLPLSLLLVYYSFYRLLPLPQASQATPARLPLETLRCTLFCFSRYFTLLLLITRSPLTPALPGLASSARLPLETLHTLLFNEAMRSEYGYDLGSSVCFTTSFTSCTTGEAMCAASLASMQVAAAQSSQQRLRLAQPRVVSSSLDQRVWLRLRQQQLTKYLFASAQLSQLYYQLYQLYHQLRDVRGEACRRVACVHRFARSKASKALLLV